MLDVDERMGLKLFDREIIFEEFQPLNTVPDRYRQTDGRTDGRLTVASPRSALTSRGKNGVQADLFFSFLDCCGRLRLGEDVTSR